ncbi:hypothetical protein EON83_30250 [bacterium]|nr:MAG: hypothetical protein EON83_30250 [bacterium]
MPDIPRLFHFVWVGPHPFPAKDAAWVASWLPRHPDWHAILWAESPETLGEHAPKHLDVRPLPPLVNRNLFDDIEKWVPSRAIFAARSDIVRYELIARFGGVYLDTDVECFQNIDSVLSGVRLFRAEEWGPSYGNWMFGAAPNHPQMWTIVRELAAHLKSHKAQMNVLEATGPGYFCRQIDRHCDCVIFPHMLFNPLCAYDDPGQVTHWPAVSLANHRYDGKWYDRTKNKPPQEFTN